MNNVNPSFFSSMLGFASLNPAYSFAYIVASCPGAVPSGTGFAAHAIKLSRILAWVPVCSGKDGNFYAGSQAPAWEPAQMDSWHDVSPDRYHRGVG
jgi:hypothetical protein